MNENELEDRIWQHTDIPVSCTSLWRRVGGDKKRCFDKIAEMILTSRLNYEDSGKYKFVIRLVLSYQAEFEQALTYQADTLESGRHEFNKLKKPMFYTNESVIHTEPPLPMDESKIGQRVHVDWQKYKIVEEIPIWKTKKKAVTEYLEKMRFHHKAILGFISRTNLQRSLRLINESVAETRIKKCEDVIDYHFQKLLSDNPQDSQAIRQFYEFKDQI